MLIVYTTVEIVRIVGAPSSRLVGTSASLPQVGELGTIVDVDGTRCIVENVEPNGHTRWLAWFTEAELKAL